MTVKKKHSYKTKLITGLFVALLVITGVGLLIHLDKNAQSRNAFSKGCGPTEEMKESGLYKVPCSIVFTVKGPPYPSREEVRKIIEPTNGSLEIISEESGIYGLRVKAGTEKDRVDYLKNRSEVNWAAQDQCCSVPN
jgi:hypothetical protein